MLVVFLLICMAWVADAAALPCRLEPVTGKPKRYTVTLWGRPVVRTCQRGVFVKEACRCIQVKGRKEDAVDPEPENIVGGRQIHISEAPWTIFIEEVPFLGGQHNLVCAGALIGSRWAVTARHCVDETYEFTLANNSLATQRVRAGISLRRETHAREGVITLSTFTLFIDPDTRGNKATGIIRQSVTLAPDFAILHLTNHIWPLRNVIHYIQPATEYKTYREHYCTFTGMGCTTEGTVDRGPSDPSPYLQRSTMLPLRTGDSRCRPILRDLHKHQCHPICAVDPGVLPGDSGGPLVCPDPSGTPVLLGVLVGGPENCVRGSPSFFTNVPAMRTFIDDTIADNP